MEKGSLEIHFNPFFHLLPIPLNRNSKTIPCKGASSAWLRGKRIGSLHSSSGVCVIIKDARFHGMCPGFCNGHSSERQRSNSPLHGHTDLHGFYKPRCTFSNSKKFSLSLFFFCCGGVFYYIPKLIISFILFVCLFVTED